jgi:hypothetical protein
MCDVIAVNILQGGNERKVVVKILQGEAAGAGTGPLLTWHQIKHEAGRYLSKIEREGGQVPSTLGTISSMKPLCTVECVKEQIAVLSC